MSGALPALLLGMGRLGYPGSITESALSSLVAHAEEHGTEAVLGWIREDPGLLFIPSWQFWPVLLVSLWEGGHPEGPPDGATITMSEAYVYIPEDLRHKIPTLYATEKEPDTTVWIKLFTPDANWTWYITEFDGENRCFGLVVGHEVELGYFLLSDIACARGGLGLPVERDLFFQPKPLSDVRARHQRA